jgi:hypothetical protein
VILFLDEFLNEIDKYKHLDEDFFLDVILENPIDIEFAKILDEKKKMFKELRNKLGSTEDETINLIKSIKDKLNLLIPRIESRHKYTWNFVEKVQNTRALIVNVNLGDSINSSDLSTQFKTKELENHFRDSSYLPLWGKVENLSALLEKKTFTNFYNEKILDSVKILVLNFEYRWHDYFHSNQKNKKLLEKFKKNLLRNWSVYQIIHTPNYFYVRHYISPS